MRPLFKPISVDGKSEDPRYFARAEGLITPRNTEGNLKIGDHLSGTKDTFPQIKMAQIESLELKIMAQICAWRIPVALHPSLYRALKLTYPTDVSGSVTDGRITTDIETGNLGQSVGVLIPADFCPVCV